MPHKNKRNNPNQMSLLSLPETSPDIPTVEQADKKRKREAKAERERQEGIIKQEAQTEAFERRKRLADSRTDGFLVLDDIFEFGNKYFKLIEFRTQPRIIDKEIYVDILYYFECTKDKRLNREIDSDEFHRLLCSYTWKPIAPTDCVYAVNSLIPGTKEFNDELRLELELA